MKKEDLTVLGLTEDISDKVLGLMAAETQKQQQSQETAKNELSALKTQLSEANKQIEGFKGMDIEGIKKAAEDYKIKFEESEKKSKADIEALQFDYALSGALQGAKARNTKAVKALLDMEGLKFSNGEVVGLSEQLKALKADNDFLFEDDTPVPRVVTGIETLSNSKPMTYSETIRFLQNNPGAKL